MSIPLVRNNTKDAINTSIIAIKKNLERINSILGLMDSSEPDLSGLATKQELEDAVTEINNTIDEVETSLQPVDTVTSGDMHSVTSNAVADAIITKKSVISNMFYTLNTYTNGFVLMAHAYHIGIANNYDVAISGNFKYSYLTSSGTGTRPLFLFNFVLSARHTTNGDIPLIFRMVAKDGNTQNVANLFTATYKFDSNAKRLDIYLYAKVQGTYNRYMCEVEDLYYGDVYQIQNIPSGKLDMTTSYFASIPSEQTVISINAN